MLSRALQQVLINGLKTFLESYKILDKPYNCDESGFPLMSHTGRVLAPTDSKQVSSGNKEQVTTLSCYNAAGKAVPPYHVFPG